jgi:RNA polymerase sigma-70 factor (ECF subfamily)
VSLNKSSQPTISNEEMRKLVEAAQGGDKQAIEDLYMLHYDRIYSYLHLKVGNQHDAEDLTTQTFVRMIEALPKFQWRALPFSAWLFRIAHNLAVDRFRAASRYTLEEEVPEPPAHSAPLSAADEAAHSFGRQSMLQMIESLSDDQRQVLTLKFLFGFNNSEVAEILAKSEGAVKSLQHRALVSLQKTTKDPSAPEPRAGERSDV